MCLISKWRFPRKAKEDIICYKYLVENCGLFYAPYVHNKVDINSPYIAKGNSFTLVNCRVKGEGYIHVLSKKPYFPRFVSMNYIVFKCIIPKGTKYHKSRKEHELCAKRIIFLNIVK